MGCASRRRAWEWPYWKFYPDQRVASVPPETLTAIKWIHTDEQIYLTPNPDGGESGGCVKTVIKSPRTAPRAPGNPPASRQKHTPGQAHMRSHPRPVAGPPGTSAPVNPVELRAARPPLRDLWNQNNPAVCILHHRRDNLPTSPQGPHPGARGTKAPRRTSLIII